MSFPVRKRVLLGLSTCALSLGAFPAVSAADPSFVFAKAEGEQKAREREHWKASAQAGLILTSGNANAVTLSASGNVTRNDGKNKIALDVAGAFGKTSTFVAKAGLPVDAMGMPIIRGYDDIDTTSALSTALWSVKLRYDRFFSKNNLGYLAGLLSGDQLAGKKLVAGAQVGYSRQIYKSERNEILAEIGYDFSSEAYLGTLDPTLYIHSLRAFLGYNLTLTKDTAITTGLEGLFNLNPLTAPGSFDRDHPEVTSKDVSSFEDTRVNFKAALSTKLYKSISFRFSFTTRFDNVPAPRPGIAGTTYMNFRPTAEKVDTLSEAALVVTFL